LIAKWLPLVFILLSIQLAGCSKPSESDVAACQELAVMLELDEMQQQECLSNKDLRQQLVEMRDQKVSRQITRDYNSGKTALELPAYRKPYFTKLNGVDALIQVHDDFELAIKHRGRKYAVTGWIGLATITDPKADIFVYLYDDNKKDADGLPKWRLSHLHDMNEKQVAFLQKYCMQDGMTESNGFCEGELYVTVKPQPGTTTMLTFELSGVNFHPVELERVSSFYSQTR
jgi:hypothetical protein